jgi:hypothetical protein
MAPAVHMVDKIKAMSTRILVSPNSSGVKYLGKRKRMLIAPMANPI